MSLTPHGRRPEHLASDQDRERVVSILKENSASGRLTYDELSERLDVALRSRTYADLQRVVADLPVGARAPRWVRRRLFTPAFRAHARLYGATNAGLVAIWAATGAGDGFWPMWPAVGWGLGLGVHAAVSRSIQDARARRTARGPDSTGPKRGPAVRRVAVLLCDVAGSTMLNESLGDQRWRDLRAELRGDLRTAARRHGGWEVGAQGDSFLFRFPSAGAAVRAAMDGQRATEDISDRTATGVSLRMGIHAGDAIRDTDRDLVGHTLNVGARVMGEAAPGEILVTEPVADDSPGISFEDRGVRELRGISQPRHLLAVVRD
ncbi:MAG TPA: DUF1707 domain-containing protein [Actinomycetota bacterium]|nr:DUF1707 domain-containing protein [Actinomycetota bacterium]